MRRNKKNTHRDPQVWVRLRAGYGQSENTPSSLSLQLKSLQGSISCF